MQESERLEERLRAIYGPAAEACASRLAGLVGDLSRGATGCADSRTAPRWDQRDAVLIAYGDHVHAPDRRPLRALHEFLALHDLGSLFNTLHLLPFFPASSDDGFSVIDYRAVDPALGDWDDIHALGRTMSLMFDLVLNHVSQRSRWFQAYLQGTDPYVRFFHEVDPRTDLSAVARPRSQPLLTEFTTSRGPRHVWTTFSADQVDLNFDEPQVLLELTEILGQYVRHGARIIRLDAVAYIGKRLGTACIHLPQAHAVVKFFRQFLALTAPRALLLTETNVPHAENIRYFGDGDEAHLVYQFSLPPLLLDAMLNEDASPLVRWLAALAPPPPGATFFNFTASHDGVGVRPLEGLIPAERLARLLSAVRARNGMVSTRRGPDGRDLPYELNITYFDALAESGQTDRNVRKFLATQALMLTLQGIPAVYFSSLFGAKNDVQGAQRSGHARRINRRKFDSDDLTQAMTQPSSRPGAVWRGYRRLLATRRQQPAFHPDGPQQVWTDAPAWLVAIQRTSPDGGQRILALVNVSGQRQARAIPERLVRETGSGPVRDLLSARAWPDLRQVELEPYDAVWLEISPGSPLGARIRAPREKQAN